MEGSLIASEVRSTDAPQRAGEPLAASPEPDTFVSHQHGRVRILVARDFAAELHGLGLDDAARLAALADSLVPDATRRAGRAVTRVVETRGGPVLLKRALKGGVLAPVFAGRIPRFARAADEVRVTAEMRRRGAPVPEPVVAAGVRDALGWRAVVGTVYLAGTRDGAAALAGALETGGETAAAERLAAFGRAIRCFHDAGGRHADLAVTNLLHAEGSGEVTVVDLQGARADQPPPPWRRHRELARLRRSIEHRPAIVPALALGWPALIEAYGAAPAR